MIETWVNIIETLICIHIIQKIKEIIPKKEEKEVEKENENKEQNEGMKKFVDGGLDIVDGILKIAGIQKGGGKESMSESYEILEHKYYEKMQQLVVKLKEEQSQIQYQLGSTQDAYEFELDINLEATQSKMPITRESLLSLKDIFTKTKRFMKGDKKTWKENVTKFINKHFMNDLVDDIVTKSHYNSSNVMSIIKDQIPQLRFLNETNMKENFFSTIVEQEGKQYDDKTKTNFTKYYHHFFLENLNGKINNKPVNTPEGLKELQNLLKDFQKLRDPEFYVEEKEEKEEEEEKGEKEILEKIDMTYEPNLNLMRDFVKGNMKTKFEAKIEAKSESELDTEYEPKSESKSESESESELESESDAKSEPQSESEYDINETHKEFKTYVDDKMTIDPQNKAGHKVEIDIVGGDSDCYYYKINADGWCGTDTMSFLFLYHYNDKLNGNELLKKGWIPQKDINNQEQLCVKNNLFDIIKNHKDNLLTENSYGIYEKDTLAEYLNKWINRVKRVNESMESMESKESKESKESMESMYIGVEELALMFYLLFSPDYKLVIHHINNNEQIPQTIYFNKEDDKKPNLIPIYVLFSGDHFEPIICYSKEYPILGINKNQSSKQLVSDASVQNNEPLNEISSFESTSTESEEIITETPKLNVVKHESIVETTNEFIQQNENIIKYLDTIKQKYINNETTEIDLNEMARNVASDIVNNASTKATFKKLEEYIKSLEQDNKNAKIDLNKLETILNEEQNERKQENERVRKLLEEINNLKNNMDINETGNKKELEEAYKKLQTYISTNKILNQEKEKLQEKINNLESQLTLTQKELNESKKGLKTKLDENTELQKQITELEAKIKELEDANNKITEVIKQKNDKIRTQQEEIEANNKEIEANKAQIEANNKEIEVKEAKIKKLETANDALTEKNRQNQEQIETQQKEIATQEQIISELRNQLEAKNKEIEAKEAKLREDETVMRKTSEKIASQEKEISELEKLFANLTSEKNQVEAELKAIEAEKEEAERKRLAEEEQRQKEEEAQRQKEEAERKRLEEEEKERPKKEAIGNLTNFLNKTAQLINYINSITFTTLNKDKTSKKSNELYVMNFEETNKIPGLDRTQITQLHKKHHIIEKLTTLDEYVNALKFILQSIKDDEIIDNFEGDYNLYGDEHQRQYYKKSKDGKKTSFSLLPPSFIQDLISTLNTICSKENYQKYVSKEKCDIFQRNFSKNGQYKELFDNTMKSVRDYFKQIQGIVSNTYTKIKDPLFNIENTEDKKDAQKYVIEAINNLRRDISPLFPKEGRCEAQKELKDAYTLINTFLKKFCNKNSSIDVKNYHNINKNKKGCIYLNVNLSEKYILGLQNINSDNNTIEIKTKSERISKTPDRYKLENTQKSNCQTEIKEILDAFNQKFVKQDYPILQTPSPHRNNNSNATTEDPKFVDDSSENNKTEDIYNNKSSNKMATPVNLNKDLNQGGKKKTRRKGRTKKKTKTRKK